MSGWIRLHRGWRECDVFTGEPASEREAWVHLIEIAAWKPMLRRAGKGDVIQVNRGQLHTAERTLADMWSWDRKKVKRFLNRLEKYRMISQESGPSGNLITICNYSSYQTVGADDGTVHGTNQGPSEDHPRTTQEEGKERKEGEEGKKKSSARGTRLASDWVLPDEWRELAKQSRGWTDSDVSAEANRFRDYWLDNKTKNAVKSDWKKTWLNWIERSNRKPNSSAMNGMSFQQARERIKELEYDLEMNRHLAEHDRDKYLPKWRACKEELEALRKAVEAKGF